MSAKNKYIVTWDIFVKSDSAVTNLNKFTTSVKSSNDVMKIAIANMRAYNKQLATMKTHTANIAKNGGFFGTAQGMGMASSVYGGGGGGFYPPYISGGGGGGRRPLTEKEKKIKEAKQKADKLAKDKEREAKKLADKLVKDKEREVKKIANEKEREQKRLANQKERERKAKIRDAERAEKARVRETEKQRKINENKAKAEKTKREREAKARRNKNLKKTTSRSSMSGLPISGLMMGMMAYGAISSSIGEAVEYGNMMTSAKSFLKTSDKDLSTFEERFSGLAKNVRDVGKATKFTATEVAGATKYLAMAGMNIETINNSIKPIANLAVIGDEDISKVADLSTNIMTGYGIGGNEMGNLSDIITNTMTRSNVSITEIAESFKMSAGYLSASGIDFAEATSAIGVLGDAGMKATLAGTALRAMMIRFAKPTKDAKKTMDKLGVTFTEDVIVDGEKVNKVKSLVRIFEELKSSGAGLEDLQRIFGTIGGNSALQLINRTDKLKQLTNYNKFSHGTAEQIATDKQHTVAGMSAQAMSSFKDSFLVAFENLSPKIITVLQGWRDTFNSSSFIEGMQSFGEKILMLTDSLVRLGIWVGNNWNWIEPLFLMKIMHSNASMVVTDLMNIGKSFMKTFGIGGAASGAATSISTIIGGITSLGIAIAGFTTYYAYMSNKIIENNLKIVSDSEKKIPIMTQGYDLWAKKLRAIRDEAVDATGAVKTLHESKTNGKTVAEITGISSVNAFGFSTDGEFNTMNQIKVVRNNDFNDFIVGYIDFVGGLDPESPTYKSDIEKSFHHMKEKFNFNNMEVNESLYKRKLVNNDYLEGSKQYDSKLPFGTYVWGKWFKDKNIDKFTLTDIRQTIEYIDLVNDGLKEFNDAVVPAVNEALSSKKSATSFITKLVGQNTIDDWLREGVMNKDASGNYSFTNKIPESAVTRDRMRDNVLSLANSGKNYTVDKDGNNVAIPLAPSTFIKSYSVAGMPEWMWSSSPKNSNMTNISGAEGGDDDDDKKINRGLTGNRATPKQVIVNLDNLMKIDAVTINQDTQDQDLDALKMKVSQILLDVVADFDSAYHG